MSEATSQDPRRIDPALREKYDVRGPRYTSYPPATHFGPIDTGELFERWRTQNRPGQDHGLSLYLHIPYCRSRCLFCGCHTFVTSKTEKLDGYVESILHEMEIATGIVDPKRPVHQVAMGGGTPNILSVPQSELVLDGMRRIFSISEKAELSVEIDPRSVTTAKLDAYLTRGFNRFSLGIQDFSESVLRVVRRGQDLMQVEEVVGYLRQNGCDSINFDLIYGLPGQDLQSMAECARKVITLRPSRIALYSYAHVPWIHSHQKVLERHGLPSQDLKASMFLSTMDDLLGAGYQHIGMDHFALPDDPLAVALRQRTLRRNFMGYTTGRGLDLLAFGASAISSIGSAYSQNHKQLSPYQAELQENRLPVMRGFLLSEDDLIRRELLLELFCNFYVDLEALSQRYGIDAANYLASDLEKLAPMVEDGLVSWTGREILVSDTGKFFIRNICMTFDRYLEPDGQKRVYSRTV
jgi:oxygen-independent coproporphyrinogen-3 oxidase